VDGESSAALRAQGLSVYDVLQENDAYHALEKIGGLIITGPTGTNVNDVAVALVNG
jgi:glycerate 2-kinase